MRRKLTTDSWTIELARKAVQIDPTDSKAHLCLAWSYCLSGQFEHAQSCFEAAYELNENDPWTIISTSLGFSFCGDYHRAEDLVLEASELGLLINRLYCAYQVGARFLFRDYKGAIDVADKAGDIISNVRAWKASALSHLGKKTRARQEAELFIEYHRSNWHGEQSTPSDTDIVRWVLHCFPIRNVDDWCLFRDGLEGAGLPVPGDIQPPHP